MEVQGIRKIGRSNRRWLDKVKDDIKEMGLSGEEVYDRAKKWDCRLKKCTTVQRDGAVG